MSADIFSNAQMQRLSRLSDDFEHTESSENDFFQILSEISTPEELYYVPWLLNWDDDLAGKAIEWILQSPLCDAGTGLAIYWLNQPENWIVHEESDEDGEWERRGLAIHRAIENRMKTLDFPSQIIQYDPRWDWGYWDDNGIEDEAIAAVPDFMKRSTPGKRLPDIRELPWNE